MREVILYKGNKILLRTNDVELFNNFRKEFKYNIEFENYTGERHIMTVNVLNDKEMYIKYFKEIKKIVKKQDVIVQLEEIIY